VSCDGDCHGTAWVDEMDENYVGLCHTEIQNGESSIICPSHLAMFNFGIDSNPPD
jgi:hypothetical protein